MQKHHLNNIFNDIALKPILALAVGGMLGVFVLLARIIYTGEFTHSHLIWNLYLAWVPLFFSYALLKSGHVSKFKLFVLYFFWLLFFPNSPYIITDFIHIKHTTGNLLLVDSLLVFVFAFTGLGAGLLSLHWVFKSIKLHYSHSTSRLIMLISIVLCGYGVYLGRSLRWNSWDLFFNPIPLAKDIVFHVSDKTAIAITLLFSAFIYSGYFILVNLIRLKDEENN